MIWWPFEEFHHILKCQRKMRNTEKSEWCMFLALHTKIRYHLRWELHLKMWFTARSLSFLQGWLTRLSLQAWTLLISAVQTTNEVLLSSTQFVLLYNKNKKTNKKQKTKSLDYPDDINTNALFIICIWGFSKFQWDKRLVMSGLHMQHKFNHFGPKTAYHFDFHVSMNGPINPCLPHSYHSKNLLIPLKWTHSSKMLALPPASRVHGIFL